MLRNVSVYVDSQGRIGRIASDISVTADKVIDGQGTVLMPGLVNTHTHLPMTLMRGFADDMRLEDWLQTKIWPLERRLTGDICYKGALLGCLEMISTGTTCFMDMYFHLKDVSQAVHKSGPRGILSHAMIDLLDSTKGAEQRKMTEESMSHIKSLGSSRVTFAIGPHAPYTCSEDTLLWAREIAERENVPLHLHLAETRREVVEFEKSHSTGEVEYLDNIGFLSRNIVAAHCVWLTRREIGMLAKNQSKVSHCPVSNMKLAGGGVAPLPQMLEDGVVVSLGPDGAASHNCLDMFDTMKFCALIQKAHAWDATILPAQKVLDIATIDGARALGLEDEIGSIEAGKEADLIMLDLNSPNLSPIHGASTVVSDLVYSAKGENVDTTIVQGQPLMLHRNLLSLDAEKVLREAQDAAIDLVNQ